MAYNRGRGRTMGRGGGRGRGREQGNQRGLQGPPQASGKAKQLPEEVATEVAMPDRESLQDHGTNSTQSSETVVSPGGRDMSRSDNPEGSTVRAPFSVAQQALARPTHENLICYLDPVLLCQSSERCCATEKGALTVLPSRIADEVLSVGQLTDEELSGLAYMMVMKGVQSPDIIESFTETFVRIMYTLPPDIMWRLRVKETWTQKRNTELCELSAKDASQFWKAFKAPQSNACPVELSAQFEAFRALMGAEPQSAPQRPADSCVSTSSSDDACLNADITC
ncbi:TPA: hypothetical protein ACH3X1_010931 [Trebouxia sp. C0004]